MTLSSSNPAITGEFEYVKNESTRLMLVNAYLGITMAEGWTFMKDDIDSFMISQHPKMKEITEKMFHLPNGGLHSGSSFGCIMREMQLLAQQGEEVHKKIYISKI
jgi:hypothetical protein